MKPLSTLVLALALAAVGSLYIVRFIDLLPLEHDVTLENSAGEDWMAYHRYAVSVLDDGLTIPLEPDAYSRPGGFAYVYFVAALYAIAGVRSEVVYAVQALLLVGAIVGMYVVFRSEFSRAAGLLFLLALAVFLYLDVYRALTFRLLSENLLFPLWPALLLLVMKGQATARLGWLVAGGIVCGLCLLLRPNLVLIGPAAASAILLFKSGRPLSWRLQAATILLVAWAAVSSLLPLRNYVVTGSGSPTNVTNVSDWQGIRYLRRAEIPIAYRVYRLARWYVFRVAFMIGIPQFYEPGFRLRPHWILLWGAFVWYLRRLAWRELRFWEVLTLALGVAYFVPMLLFGSLSSYGTRMLAPGLLLVLPLAAKGLQRSLQGDTRQATV